MEKENKENYKSQISTVSELPGSPFIRKSISKSMPIPHLNPSALPGLLLQLTPQWHPLQIQGLLILPLLRAPLRQICLLLNPLYPQKQRTPKLKLPHLELVLFSQITSLQESTGKTEQKDTETASELDLISIPSGSHASTLTLGSTTAHLNNAKRHANEDADTSNEKEIDNVDALVNEMITSILTDIQCLFQQACNNANGSKKRLALG